MTKDVKEELTKIKKTLLEVGELANRLEIAVNFLVEKEIAREKSGK